MTLVRIRSWHRHPHRDLASHVSSIGRQPSSLLPSLPSETAPPSAPAVRRQLLPALLQLVISTPFPPVDNSAHEHTPPPAPSTATTPSPRPPKLRKTPAEVQWKAEKSLEASV